MRKVDDRGNPNQQNEVLHSSTVVSTELTTTVPVVISDREQMQLISNLIKEQEALVETKTAGYYGWLQQIQSTSKCDLVWIGIQAQASLSGKRGCLSQQSGVKKSLLKLSNFSGSDVDDNKSWFATKRSSAWCW